MLVKAILSEERQLLIIREEEAMTAAEELIKNKLEISSACEQPQALGTVRTDKSSKRRTIVANIEFFLDLWF